MTTVASVGYLIAFSLFIVGLMGLTGPRTAVRGNAIAAAGMAVAIVSTLLLPGMGDWWLIVLGLVLGAVVGVPAARRVKMTAMPQMVALFNGVGGGAVALIAWVEFRDTAGFAAEPLHVAVTSLFAAIIGSVSFWGSMIAFGKLQEWLATRPVTLGVIHRPLTVLAVAAALAYAITVMAGATSEWLVIGVLVSSAFFGVLMVLPIGGADMPVVISLLNAATGLSAAAMGLALDNTALIVAGMLVGASGSILTNLMAKAMNRSLVSILAGGFGGAAVATGGGTDDRPVRSTSASDAAIQLAYANRVAVVPGYGMAVAQAQHAVREMADLLEGKGVTVSYAVHPVAGRMPGHMNVLLAEADVAYESLKDMAESNSLFPQTDVTLVIGANDVVNPAARTDPASPIYGMPILDVAASRSVIVLKRSMGTGFAGIDNELFADPRTSMLFGDAKNSVSEVVEELKNL
ncbi:NAD(P)(+) transhydrogenase (Re/Si-specific) subunit beta [Saccharomonospora piscinae]|uniref:NAD(P)(+) transhydrogenase (Re/Si-specific) subunit beta n=1 Tax=Saccharomonospora piscinae TaxID=687388 RepID=UPI0011072C8D|nr:NAD(P)(+) transhydrogenase (Re/Si-specific) subunit beta [Saccharomonospora piscinae]TLW90960.1 NAD(P)(+) transhydrogenase (Re/Si-specific) subunit beta [Saccharomonospora piscinae]